MVGPILIVHGGAGAVAPERLVWKMRGVKQAAAEGFYILQKGGSALDAVEHAIKCMEDNEFFNAGLGSALTTDYEVEMDAAIMEGTTMKAGGVALVKDVQNPISLARCVLEQSPHVLLAGPAVSDFARAQDIPRVDPADMVTDYSKKCLEDFVNSGANAADIGKSGTVGAVACDSQGHVAAGTSTGGLNGQMAGRIGDSPLIGLGTFADDHIGAVSCTGHGESIIKVCLADSIIKTIERGAHPINSVRINVEKLTKRFNREAGAISVSSNGEVGFFSTSTQMPIAYVTNDIMHYGEEAKVTKIHTEPCYKMYLKKNTGCCADFKPIDEDLM